jgi:hypothetical protein
MAPLRGRCAALAIAVALAGCQNFAAIAPGTPSREVAQRFGPANLIARDADGSELWEYPRTPSGFQRFLVDVDAKGTVRSVHQVLEEEYVSKVRIGMSHDEVRRILGTPYQIVTFAGRNDEVWTWPYEDTSADMLFHVHFDRSTGMVKTAEKFVDLDRAMAGE